MGDKVAETKRRTCVADADVRLLGMSRVYDEGELVQRCRYMIRQIIVQNV